MLDLARVEIVAAGNENDSYSVSHVCGSPIATNMASYTSRNKQHFSSEADKRALARVGEELGKCCMTEAKNQRSSIAEEAAHTQSC